jgi:hypothetical protein
VDWNFDLITISIVCGDGEVKWPENLNPNHPQTPTQTPTQNPIQIQNKVTWAEEIKVVGSESPPPWLAP